MHEALADCRHDLLVLAEIGAIGADEDLRIEHGAERLRQFFANPDDDIGACVACGSAKRLDFRAGNLNRILKQLDREPVCQGSGRRVMMVPDRMRWDETFRKADHARTMMPGLADQPTCFCSGPLPVEKHRGGLYCRDFHHRINVTHSCSTSNETDAVPGPSMQTFARLASTCQD